MWSGHAPAGLQHGIHPLKDDRMSGVVGMNAIAGVERRGEPVVEAPSATQLPAATCTTGFEGAVTALLQTVAANAAITMSARNSGHSLKD
jgi:hypothetical protein